MEMHERNSHDRLDTHRLVAMGGPVMVGGASPEERCAVERLLARRSSPLGSARRTCTSLARATAVDEALALVSGDGFISAEDVFAVLGTAVVSLPGGGVVSVSDTALVTRRWSDPIRPGGQPPWLLVTVAAESASAAAVSAAVALLCGEEGPAWLDRNGLAGRFLNADGVILENSCWGREVERPDGACVSI